MNDDVQIAGYINGYAADINQNYTNPEACGDRATCTAGFPVPLSHPGGSRFKKSGVDGVSGELIWRISNPVLEPVGVGVYVESTVGRLRNEIETRLLLQSNFLDDRLVLASNVVFANEQLKFLGEGKTPESMLDLLVGASYRFAPRWFAGVEGRFHNDFSAYNLKGQTQRGFFAGPSVHYAREQWWVTAAWRHQFKGGSCLGNGTAECSGSYVWDSHSRDEFMFKFGLPL